MLGTSAGIGRVSTRAPKRLQDRATRFMVVRMAVSVIIPDEIVAALRIPPRNVTEDLKKELAVHLFAEGLLPEVSACRLAGLSRLAFDRLLGERKIAARYSVADLDADVQTLTGA